MATVRTEVLEIAYVDAGPADGVPVLVLHGWPDSAVGWAPVVDELAADGYRVVVPDLRGFGDTVFLDDDTPRVGHSTALAADAIALADALELTAFHVVGHDWGGRTAYQLAALRPDRVLSIAALALAFQPRNQFQMPDFAQARAFWYQWLMFLDAGAGAITADPIGFARMQWDTWGPTGWFDDAVFEASAEAFTNPDWVGVTLNNYRSRFLEDEASDPRYDADLARLAKIETITRPTLMIQGGADACDEPAASENQGRYFSGGYRRVVLEGVGHFPHREAPEYVGALVRQHLAEHPPRG